jgi:hypothetical protein
VAPTSDVYFMVVISYDGELMDKEALRREHPEVTTTT